MIYARPRHHSNHDAGPSANSACNANLRRVKWRGAEKKNLLSGQCSYTAFSTLRCLLGAGRWSLIFWVVLGSVGLGRNLLGMVGSLGQVEIGCAFDSKESFQGRLVALATTMKTRGTGWKGWMTTKRSPGQTCHRKRALYSNRILAIPTPLTSPSTLCTHSAPW